MKSWTNRVTAILLALLLAVACGQAADDDDEETPAVAESPTELAGQGSVSFTAPEDGAEVTSPVKVTMQAEDFTIEPAGQAREGAGHFHIMVDTDCLTAGETIPNDATHIHFGQAQTEGELTLTPGQHKLCLQAADGTHKALDLTDEITVEVAG